MFKFVRGFFAGPTYILRALTVIHRTPQLRGYVLVPILVNLVVGITLYVGLLLSGVHIVDMLMAKQHLPNWANAGGFTLPALDWLLRILLGLLLLLVTTFLQVQFGVVLGAPWYGMLAEQLEKIRIGQLPPPEPLSARTIFRDIRRSLLYELKKLVLGVSVGLLLFAVGFLPPAGSAIAGLGSIAFPAMMICLDFFDAPLERRRLSFRNKLAIVRNQLPASGTFGLLCLVLVSIPLVNLLSIPLCVVAGTLFVCERVLPQLARSQDQSKEPSQ